MSFFKKPKKSIQRRVFSSNLDEEQIEDVDMADVSNGRNSEPNINVNSNKKKKDRKERTQPKNTLLSFEDEDGDGEVFQVKKSSHSKKIMRLLDKERKKKKNKDTPDDDVEKEIKSETDYSLIKEKKPDHLFILNGRAALVAGKDDVSSDEETRSLHKFSHPDNVKIVVESGIIPDAAMIHAARKRRQRARELGSDFIPLEEREKKDKGRLVREEDGDGSDEERIDMTVNVEAQDKEKRREQFFAAQDEDSEQETDKEMQEWENQQIRKGVTGVQINSIQSESIYNSNLFSSSTDNMSDGLALMAVKPEDLGPKTPETIAQKLRERLSSLRDSYKKHSEKLADVSDELVSLEEEADGLEIKAPESARRFRFYQELRGYVTDLVECLDEKVSSVSNVEKRWADVIGRRATALAERRRQDVRDQAEEITLQAKQGARRIAGPEEETRVRRAAEREGRRNRRRRAREQAALVNNQIQPKHLDGMSSDDEVPEQENLQLRQQKEQIRSDADQIFSDVIDDFSTVESILNKFDNWRRIDLNSYSEAYASLVLPKIVGPVLQLELLAWDPLNPENGDIEQCKWLKVLMLYGLTDDSETEESLRADPDVNLVPAVIDKVVIAKLTQIVEKTWDPVSNSQSIRLVGLVNRYVRKYPTLGPESKSMEALFTAIVDKLDQSVEHDVFIPIFPKQILETKAPFFQRQFHSAVKLLGNITCWQGTLADHILKDLALNSLLNRYLLSGLRVCQLTDAVSKSQLILNALPRVWLQSDSHEHLKMFIACVKQFAEQLNPDNPLHLESLEIITSIRNTLRI